MIEEVKKYCGDCVDHKLQRKDGTVTGVHVCGCLGLDVPWFGLPRSEWQEACSFFRDKQICQLFKPDSSEFKVLVNGEWVEASGPGDIVKLLAGTFDIKTLGRRP